MSELERSGQLAARYRIYDAIAGALRKHSIDHGLTEFLPPRHLAGYAHTPSQHFVLHAEESEIILPYLVSLFNRVTTHLLDRPTFCFGPCYRNELPHRTRLKAFYQFSFELFAEDLAALVHHVSSLLRSVWAGCDLEVPDPATVDLREPNAPTDEEICREANRLEAPIVVRYKRRGIAPLLNQLYNDQLEVGLEVILPRVGETVDGGLRDPSILRQLYRIETTRQTAGASLGLERLAAYILGSSDISSVELL